MPNVAVYIDGYNVYKSIKRWAENRDENLLWLDYWAFCKLLVQQEPLAQAGDELVSVYYYTALTEDNIPKKEKHENYIKAIERCAELAGGQINIVKGRFQVVPDGVKCCSCGATWPDKSEKKSDTALCAQMVDDAHRGLFDCAIVLTSDSDMAPAMQLIKDGAGFENLRIILAYPPRRRTDTGNYDLEQASHCSMKTTGLMRLCMMPDPVTLKGGEKLCCPGGWL
jgi:hypothetical protein